MFFQISCASGPTRSLGNRGSGALSYRSYSLQPNHWATLATDLDAMDPFTHRFDIPHKRAESIFLLQRKIVLMIQVACHPDILLVRTLQYGDVWVRLGEARS